MSSIARRAIRSLGAALAILCMCGYTALAQPPHDWSGPYVGLHAGYGYGDTETTETSQNWNVSPPWDYNPDGGLGGVQAGFNWQTTLVFGIEAAIGYADVTGDQPDPGSTDTVSKTEIGTYLELTGRLGFPVGMVLPYAKAGVASADIDVSVIDACNVAPCGPGLVNTQGGGFTTGWTVGAGLDFAISPPWSARLEYEYFDFGSIRSVDPTGTYFWDHDVTMQSVRLGLNYSF